MRGLLLYIIPFLLFFTVKGYATNLGGSCNNNEPYCNGSFVTEYTLGDDWSYVDVGDFCYAPSYDTDGQKAYFKSEYYRSDATKHYYYASRIYCKAYPTCDENQTLDLSSNPPVCVSCGEGTNDLDCDNVPNNDDDDYDSDGDGIPNGEDLDDDNDGVPDTEDDYPNDSTKSDSSSESDVKYCKRGINDCTQGCICPVGTRNLLGYATICSSIATGQSHTGSFCDESGDGTEPIDPNEPKKCSYPPSLFGYDFQKVVANTSICYDLRERYGNRGAVGGTTWPCPDNTLACYYNLKTDSNSSSSTPPPDDNNPPPEDDNDTTPVDTNSSLSDTKNIEDKLDLISDSLSSEGSINNSLKDIGALIGDSTANNHKDLTDLNNNLGSKLDGIQSAIENQSDGSTDMSGTNQLLEDIKGSINGSSSTFTDLETSEVAIESHESKVTDLKSKITDMHIKLEDSTNLMEQVLSEFSTFSENVNISFIALGEDFQSYKTMFENKPTVSLPSGGSCSALQFSLYGKNINLSNGICSAFQTISPFIVFILTAITQLSLIYISMQLFKKD